MIIYSFALLALSLQNPVIQPAPGTGTQQPTSQQATAPQAQLTPMQTFNNEELGLAFDYPKNWKKSKVKVQNDTHFVVTDPKTWRPAKSDNTTRFLMPLPGTDERGEVEIFAVIFNQDQDTWQTIQRDINDKMNRQVLRQWSEEVLGVPLLMTKIESKDKGLDTVTESGLMYSATPRKFIFRVSASPENFEKADYEFRQVLLTLRTTDGKLPSAEDPNRKITPADLTPGAYKHVIWTAPPAVTPQFAKGDTLAEPTSGGKIVNLQGPAGWKATKNTDGSYALMNPDLPGSVKLTVANDLDSDDAGRALIRSSGATLSLFKTVAKREEQGADNRGQAITRWIFRRGIGNDSKPLFGFDAGGVNGDDYWILSWTSTTPASVGKDRKILEGLVSVLHIEPHH